MAKKIFLLALFSALSIVAGAGCSLASQALCSVYRGHSQLLAVLIVGWVPVLTLLALLILWYRAQSAFSEKFKNSLFQPPRIGYAGDGMRLDASKREASRDGFMVVQMAIAVGTFFVGTLMSLLQNLEPILRRL